MSRKGYEKKRVLQKAFVFLLAALALCVATFGVMQFGFSVTNAKLAERTVRLGSKEEEKLLEPGGLHSSNGLLVNKKSGKVVWSKKEEERVYPASLTKIMTVLVALEQSGDLQKKCIMQPEIFEGIEEDAALAGFLLGEEVTIEDLIYGAMLPSGADASLGLAYHLAGEEEAFVRKMNDKAKRLGMTGTNYANVTGFHHSSHYTTAKDMAILLEEALGNPTFCKVFTAAEYRTKKSNKHGEGIFMSSTLFRVTPQGGNILGGKTGYTKKAGQCLASWIKKENQEYILITLGADGNPAEQNLHIEDALAIARQL